MCSGKRIRDTTTWISIRHVGFLQTDPLNEHLTVIILSAEATKPDPMGRAAWLPDQSFPYDDKYPGACSGNGRSSFDRCTPHKRRWWSQTESNRRPPECKSGALPTELWPRKPRLSPGRMPYPAFPQASMVGRGRVELPTSRLSGVRSNHLSYRPMTGQGQAHRGQSRRQAIKRPRGSLSARNRMMQIQTTNEGRETETARQPHMFCSSMGANFKKPWSSA